VTTTTTGRAIVHSGSALHWSDHISWGQCYNLIVWCRFHEASHDTFPQFVRLPVELQLAVIDLLEPEDLLRLRLASQDMHGLVEQSRRWEREVRERQFPDRESGGERRTWRQVFTETCCKHRNNRLKGTRPLAPLIATRFHGLPQPKSTLTGTYGARGVSSPSLASTAH
jgi:hypothetical protein